MYSHEVIGRFFTVGRYYVRPLTFLNPHDNGGRCDVSTFKINPNDRAATNQERPAYSNCSFDDLIAIPLSMEIFKKCKLQETKLLGCSFYFNGNQQCALSNDYGDEVILHSLDQLQNLYFAITGTELEVNL